jgi:ATP adenylyltransferase
MEYVSASAAPGCIFCEPEAKQSDRERLVLWRGQQVFCLLNRYPYAPGHLMIAPFAHSARVEDLPAETQAELMGSIGVASRILAKAYAADGLNVGANLGRAAGAGFAEHLHFHLVPRWAGDTNFMTVVGELRVIPEHLERIYEELVQHFRELDS